MNRKGNNRPEADKPVWMEKPSKIADNPWTAWVQKKVDADMPEYVQRVHREHGSKPGQTCRGCVHLVARTQKKNGDGQTDWKTVLMCTAYGDGQEWERSYLACGAWERSKKDEQSHA